MKLLSSDNVTVDINMEAAKLSAMLKKMMEDLDLTEDDEEPVPVRVVHSKTLKKVVEWCEHHKQYPADEDTPKSTITGWDKKFLGEDPDTLSDIVDAANFLDIDELLNQACRSLANLMINRSPEEMRRIFKVEQDLSEEQLAKIRAENAWIEYNS